MNTWIGGDKRKEGKMKVFRAVYTEDKNRPETKRTVLVVTIYRAFEDTCVVFIDSDGALREDLLHKFTNCQWVEG